MFFASPLRRVSQVLQSLRGRRAPKPRPNPLRRWRDYGLLRLEDRINPTPVVMTTSGSLVYAVNQPETQIDPGLTVTDAAPVTGGSISISSAAGAGIGQDYLFFTSQANIAGSYDPGLRVLTLAGAANASDYQAVLRSVRYFNNSSTPNTAARTVTFSATDSTGSAQATKAVTVTSQPAQAPVVTASSGNLFYTAGQAATVIDGNLFVSDADSPTLQSATVTISAGFAPGQDQLVFTDQNGIVGSYNFNSGILSLTGAADPTTYQAALRTVRYQNTNASPSTTPRTVTFTARDSFLSGSAARGITVSAPFNQTPVVTIGSGGNASFTAGQGAVTLDGFLNVSDADSANLQSATVTINGFVFGQDQLSFTNFGGSNVGGGYDPNTGTLSLSGSASPGTYQTLLRSVVYTNSSANPTTTARSVSFIVSDGVSNSAAAVRGLTVIGPAGPVPVVTTSSGPLVYTPNQLPRQIDPLLTVTDDTTTLSGAIVGISGYVQGQDFLAFTSPSGNITGTFDPSAGSLTLNGSADLNLYQAALRSVTYRNNSTTPNTAPRTITFAAYDGTNFSAGATKTVVFSGVAGAPQITTSQGNLVYNSSQGAVRIDEFLNLTDNSALILSARVQITGGYVQFQDILSLNNQSGTGITGTFDSNTGTLTLQGAATVGNYQAALRQVMYQNANATLGTPARTITFSATDDGGATGFASRSISFTGQSSGAPVISPVSGQIPYTSSQGAVFIDSSLFVTDDSGTLFSATVQITGFVAGQDVLAIGTAPSLNVNLNNNTGTLTLSSNIPGVPVSVTNYQQALRSVTYQNTSATTATSARTITISATDTGGSTSSAFRTVTFGGQSAFAPVITLSSPNNLNYSPSMGTVTLDQFLTVTDADSSTLERATVSISNYVNGQDVLGITNVPSPLNASFNQTSGVLTLFGPANLATFQSALRSVTYSNGSATTATPARTITFAALDGVNTGSVSRTITFGAQTGAPTVATSTTPLPYPGGQAAVDIDQNVVVTDDSNFLSSATVQITGGFVFGQDTLAIANSLGLQATPDPVNGRLILSNVANVLTYQAALRSVRYQNTSTSPNTTSRTVTFTATDQNGNTSSNTRAITFGQVNTAPALTATPGGLAYVAGQAATVIDPGLVVVDSNSQNLTGAVVTITGFNPGQDELQFNNTTNISGNYNANFGILELTGNAPVADYQAALRSVRYFNSSTTPTTGVRTITFTVSDGSATGAASRTVAVGTQPTAPPTVATSSGNLNYTAGQAAVAVDSNLNVTDGDSPNLAGATVAISGGFSPGQDRLGFTNQLNIIGSYNEITGVLTLTGSAPPDSYRAALRSVTYVNTSANPSTTPRTVTFTVSDGGASGSASRGITVTAPPALSPVIATTSGSLAYTENQAAAAVDPLLTVSDPDSLNLASATVAISSGFVAGQDVLSFVTQPGVNGFYDFNAGVLQLSGPASPATYQLVLRSVTYVNTSDAPGTTPRTITFTVSDGTTSASATKGITVAAVADAPVLTATPGGLSYPFGQTPVTIDPGLSVSDVDSTSLVGAVVTITNGFVPGQDVLTLPVGGTIAGNYNANFGILTLTGNASVTDYQTALRSITYTNSSATPTAGVRTITFTASDGGATGTATRTVAVGTQSGFAPTVVTTSSPQPYPGNQTPVTVDPSLIVNDDSGQLFSATVRITSGFAFGQDILGVASPQGLNSGYDANTGTLTLSSFSGGPASAATYQLALASVTYLNSSTSPNATPRTITFTVSDGVNVGSGSRTITFGAQSGAPTVFPTPSSLTYIPGQGAVALDNFVTVNDDSGQLSSATVQITSGFVFGQDSLVVTNSFGLNATSNPGAGSVTLSGLANVSTYQLALRSITYQNNSASTGTPARTVTYTVADNLGITNSGSRTITFGAQSGVPTVIPSASSLTYIPGQGAVAIDSGLTISAPGGPSALLNGVSVRITSGFVFGQDTLAIPTTPGLTFTYDPNTLTLTGSGAASAASYEAALRTVTYSNAFATTGMAARTITFSATNTSGTGSGVRTITFGAQSGAPTVTPTPTSLTYIPGQGAVALDGNVTVNDDSGQLSSATVQITGGFVFGQDSLVVTNSFGLNATSNPGAGSVTLSGLANLSTYQLALRSITYQNVSASTGTPARTVTYTVADNFGITNSGVRTITFGAQSGAPTVIPTPSSLTYIPGQGAVALDNFVTVNDDSGQLSSATVQITSGFVFGQDSLVVTNSFGLNATSNPGAGSVTLSGLANLSTYQLALRSITYQNVSASTGTPARTVTYTVADNFGITNSATRTITFGAQSGAPTVTPTPTSLTYIPGQGAVALDNNVTVNDDSGQLSSATVQITGGFVFGLDSLVVTNSFGLNATSNPGAGSVTLSGFANLSTYQLALRSITYQNASASTGTPARTVTYTVADNLGITGSGVRTITFAGASGAPVIATTSSALPYSPSQGAVAIDSNLTVSDSNSTLLTGASVQITGGFAQGQDLLFLTAPPGITVNINNSAGFLSLSGPADLFTYQQALRSVTYQNISASPSTTPRTITFSASDGANTGSATRTITLGSQSGPAPVVTPSSSTLAYTASQGFVPLDSALTVTDPDSFQLTSARVAIVAGFVPNQDTLNFAGLGGSNITGSYDSGTGVLTLTGFASPADYQTVLRLVTYSNPSATINTPARTVSISATDINGNTGTGLRAISFAPLPGTPVVTPSSIPLTYSSSQGAVAIDPSLTVTDSNSFQLTSATVAITGGFAQNQDVLALPTLPGIFISGTYNPASGTLTLTGSASVADYQTALRAVTYQNTSSTPGTTPRTITFSASDGSSTGIGTRTINFGAQPGVPVVVTTLGSRVYTHGQGAITIDPDLGVTDDGSSLNSASVAITAGLASGDTLALGNQSLGIFGSYNSGNGTLTLTGPASVTAFQAALRSVTYVNSTATPSTSPRTITFAVTDINGNTGSGARSLTYTGTAGLPPVIATSSSNLVYPANQSSVPVDGNLTISDGDSQNLSSARVAITGGFVSSQDRLNFVSQLNITGTYDPNTGVLSLTGPASVATYQLVLRTVAYQNISASPSTTPRTVTFTASDGPNSGSATRTIVFSGQTGSAPVLTASGSNLTYNPSQGAVAIDPGLTVSDADSFQLNTATVAITGGFAQGQDVLAFSPLTGIPISGSYNPGNGTLTLTGPSSPANFQLALRAVTYQNIGSTPNTTPRTITFTANDGINSGSTTRSITFGGQGGTAPALTASGGNLVYTPGQSAVAIDPGLFVIDGNSTELTGAAVVISGGGIANGQDVLNFVDQGVIVGSYNPATGVLNLSGVASVAAYQQALRSVTYFNNSSTPNTAPRSVTFVAFDGSQSGSASRAITFAGQSGSVPTTTGTVVVDDGSSQRSMVRSLTVNFSGPINPATVTGDAFVLTGGPGGVVVTPTVQPGNTSVRLTFSGSGLTAGSLRDGTYTLAVLSGGLRDANGVPVVTTATIFTRKYGDINGDSRVDTLDLFRMYATFGKGLGDPAYIAALDYDASGNVDTLDLFQFYARFGT